jgi:hypothetical protein
MSISLIETIITHLASSNMATNIQLHKLRNHYSANDSEYAIGLMTLLTSMIRETPLLLKTKIHKLSIEYYLTKYAKELLKTEYERRNKDSPILFQEFFVEWIREFDDSENETLNIKDSFRRVMHVVLFVKSHES